MRKNTTDREVDPVAPDEADGHLRGIEFAGLQPRPLNDAGPAVCRLAGRPLVDDRVEPEVSIGSP